MKAGAKSVGILLVWALLLYVAVALMWNLTGHSRSVWFVGAGLALVLLGWQAVEMRRRSQRSRK